MQQITHNKHFLHIEGSVGALLSSLESNWWDSYARYPTDISYYIKASSVKHAAMFYGKEAKVPLSTVEGNQARTTWRPEWQW